MKIAMVIMAMFVSLTTSAEEMNRKDLCEFAGLKSESGLQHCIESKAHDQNILECGLLELKDEAAALICIHTPASNSAIGLCRGFTYESTLKAKLECVQNCSIKKSHAEMANCMQNLSQ